MKSVSFAPLIDKNCVLLILGTMPGSKSLEKQEYYAHERNAFWPILFSLFNRIFSINYQDRKKLLLDNRIALWDTLESCYRKGSLDSDINNARPNNITELLIQFPKIKYIAFNGQYAEKYYKKFHTFIAGISYLSMPSTSPANARFKFEEKLDKWSVIKQCVEINHL